MKEKIDFVILWVDGNDKKWLEQKNSYTNKTEEIKKSRFRDWDLLKYWFRGVEKYAPWVNKIFFVTWGHIPSWLDTKNPKLEIVKHSDFIPPKYLPTFNSNVIELNLHRILNLSEKFVLFNDDVFIIYKLSTPSLSNKTSAICFLLSDGAKGASVTITECVLVSVKSSLKNICFQINSIVLKSLISPFVIGRESCNVPPLFKASSPTNISICSFISSSSSSGTPPVFEKGFPNTVGITTRGMSSSENPAFIVFVPLSIITDSVISFYFIYNY